MPLDASHIAHTHGTKTTTLRCSRVITENSRVFHLKMNNEGGKKCKTHEEVYYERFDPRNFLREAMEVKDMGAYDKEYN